MILNKIDISLYWLYCKKDYIETIYYLIIVNNGEESRT